jgi:hypothetical protein
VALRPRLSPGVPLSREAKAELPAGTRTVKHLRRNSWTSTQLSSPRLLTKIGRVMISPVPGRRSQRP